MTHILGYSTTTTLSQKSILLQAQLEKGRKPEWLNTLMCEKLSTCHLERKGYSSENHEIFCPIISSLVSLTLQVCHNYIVHMLPLFHFAAETHLKYFPVQGVVYQWFVG